MLGPTAAVGGSRACVGDADRVDAETTPVRSSGAYDRRAPRGLPLVLRVERAPALPVLPPDPAARGSVDALHLGGDATAQAVLLGREGAACATLHHRPEVPPRGWQGHRSRGGRHDRAARLDVRDARQLLVR